MASEGDDTPTRAEATALISSEATLSYAVMFFWKYVATVAVVWLAPTSTNSTLFVWPAGTLLSIPYLKQQTDWMERGQARTEIIQKEQDSRG